MKSRHAQRFHRTAVAVGVLTALAAAPRTALAQQQLQEVIVTAQKRAQNIQDVPVVIQAFDAEAIREKMFRGFQDYVKELTSVSFGTSSPGATIAARSAAESTGPKSRIGSPMSMGPRGAPRRARSVP